MSRISLGRFSRRKRFGSLADRAFADASFATLALRFLAAFKPLYLLTLPMALTGSQVNLPQVRWIRESFAKKELWSRGTSDLSSARSDIERISSLLRADLRPLLGLRDVAASSKVISAIFGPAGLAVALDPAFPRKAFVGLDELAVAAV